MWRISRIKGTDRKKIIDYIEKVKPSAVIHTVAFPNVDFCETNHELTDLLHVKITKEISEICNTINSKLIYFSTGYVYAGTKGNYKENDGANPFNNYGLSKLGGESAVRMLPNSLVLRITMTEKPFIYNKAYSNLKSNFMFHEDLVGLLPKIINKKGIINIGGPSQSIYAFAKKYNNKIKKISAKKYSDLPLNQTMNLNKLKKILWKN